LSGEIETTSHVKKVGWPKNLPETLDKQDMWGKQKKGWDSCSRNISKTEGKKNAIPKFTRRKIKSAPTHEKKTSWYKLGGSSGGLKTLSVPKNSEGG